MFACLSRYEYTVSNRRKKKAERVPKPSNSLQVFEFRCKYCNASFSTSLREIVRRWGRLECPVCRKSHEYDMSDIESVA
jgi:transcription elongation factor Elf1